MQWTHRVAVKLSRGEPVLDSCVGDNPFHLASVVDQLRAWDIPVIVTDESAYAEGVEMHRTQIVSTVQRLVAEGLDEQAAFRGAVASQVTLPTDPLALSEGKTLHEAINAYRDHLTSTGKRDENNNLATRVRKCRDRLRYLTQHHEDIPLWQLDKPKLEVMAAYWRNRPATKKSDRCSWDHANDMLKELWRFLRWLDTHPGYRWPMPRGAERINRSPEKWKADDSSDPFQTITKETYSPEQLALIANATDPFGRALIGICVNCGFGQSEIGQWPTSKFVLHTPHPHAEKFSFDSTAADSWVTGQRPKTFVYGEHLLWPGVAEAISPYLDGRKVLPITGAGTPWYKTHTSNPQSKFTKWWSDLIKRVQKGHPHFPSLPFGSLRDVLPDVLRSRYSDDVASLCLQHGKIGEDDLLKHYANNPYRRLVKATRELEDFFRPFLDSLVKRSRPKSPR